MANYGKTKPAKIEIGYYGENGIYHPKLYVNGKDVGVMCGFSFKSKSELDRARNLVKHFVDNVLNTKDTITISD